MNTIKPADLKKVHANHPGFVPVNCQNWREYPYHPEVQFRIGCNGQAIELQFNVREKYIRATVSEINGPVHQDSCVEFFISPLADGNYYNFEFNCIGVQHVGYGPDRHHRQQLPVEVVQQITTVSTLGNQAFDEKTGDFSWELKVEIPISCFVHDPMRTLSGRHARANFYKCGDALAEAHFLSWSPVKTGQPDFHQYPFFGELIL